MYCQPTSKAKESSCCPWLENDSSEWWYVVHTRCQHEFQVAHRLQQAGVEVFLPTWQVPSRRRDRKLLLTAPLFPGYLFIRPQWSPEVFYNIVRTPGVARILGQKGRFSPVDDQVITSIKICLISNRYYESRSYLRRGRWVRIIEGPLQGAVGIIREYKARQRRLVVNVELFQRAVAVQLADEAVEPF